MAHKKKHGDGGGGGGGHDGGGSMRWLLTYADMITLLMAFFIMMYSMSVMNLAKFNQVAFSIRSGFGGILKGGSSLLTHPSGQRSLRTEQPSHEERSLTEVKVVIETFISAKKLGKEVEVTRDERGIVIRISAENLLFRRGTAQLSPGAVEVLDRIAAEIRHMPNDILVEGFTCNLPIATAQYPSNWELSAARASCVVRELQSQGIQGVRLSAVGYGEMRPLVVNDTEAHRAHNRRVDIVVLDTQRKVVPPLDKAWQSEGTGARPVRPHITKVWQQDAAGE